MSVCNTTVSQDSTENVKRAGELFAAHGDFLLGVFRRQVPVEDAYDLWQNLFLSLVTSPIDENVPNVRNILYRVAINDIIDYKRTIHLHNRKNYEYLQLYPSNNPEHNPASQLGSIEDILKMLKKIETHLPRAIGRTVIDKYVNQMSHRQIAEKMNIKQPTVDKYLSVGTKMLQQIQDQITGDKHGQT